MPFRALFLAILFQLSFYPSQGQITTDSIISRYKQYFLRSIPVTQIDEFTAVHAFNITPESTWKDIDYADVSPAYWQLRNHIQRVRALAIAWAMPQSKYYRNENVWQTFSNGLNHWLQKRYKNSNWWVNEIGVPQDLRDILILTHENLSSTQRQQSLEVLAQHRVRGVGANLIWSADLAIHYAALIKDEAMIKRAVDLITNEIKVTTGEGIQPDYSYHQHEARLQTFHYGLSFLETNVRIGWEMRGSPWSFPNEKITILTDFILNGWQWMSRGINIVPGTIDRAASREDQLHNADLRHLISYLCDLNPPYTAHFSAIGERQNGRGEALVGFRYFPYSDFAAYHQKDFSFFLKTISIRTLKSESINTENMKGRLLNNGDAYVIKNGNEYYNLMPVWNWNFLPGQTNINSSTDTILTNPFAGSVSDGVSGLTAMDYTLSGDNKTINAHKIWACHKNIVVALINGKAPGVNDSIFTALDQSRWQGTVEVNRVGNAINTPGSHEVKNIRWLYHSGVGYILPNPSTVKVHVDNKTSSWSAINESASPRPITDKVFMPLLYHPNFNNSAFAYVIAVCNSSSEVMQLANKPPWNIIVNNARVQCVRFDDGVIMAAFHSSGTLLFKNKNFLTVDKPCLVQITRDSLFISDPLHKGGRVNFSVNGKKYSTALNSDGTTVSVKI